MSSRTLVQCDRCGIEGSSKEIALFDVLLGTKRNGFDYADNNVIPLHPEWKKEWCEKCMDEFGLLKHSIEEPKKEIPTPSLEDMIREIVRSESFKQTT